MGENIMACMGMLMIIGGVFVLIYTQFDHYGWDANLKKPDLQASITKVDHKKVSLFIFRSKMKTSIFFSDGFYYISYKTKAAQVDFNHYSISVDKQMTLEIVESAIKAHTDAVQKVDKLDQKAAYCDLRSLNN